MPIFTLQIGSTRNLTVVDPYDVNDAQDHPTLVKVGNATYISSQAVPSGTAITNTTYWVKCFEGGMVFKENYNSSLTYYEHESVFDNNDVFILKSGELAAPGESPSAAASKWFKIFDSTTLTYTPNSVLYTDPDGELVDIPVAVGTLSSTGNGLEFTSMAPPSNTPVIALDIAEANWTYGRAWIGSDDYIYTHGYTGGNTTSYTRSTSSSAFTSALIEDVAHTGTWAGIYATYYSLFAWTSTGELYVSGYNGRGQLGLGDTTARKGLIKSTLTDIVGVSCGGKNSTSATTYAWSDTAKIYACGHNNYGQVGNNSTSLQNTWHEMVGVVGNVLKVSSTFHVYPHTLIMTDKSGPNVYSLGYNGYGQCLSGGTTDTKKLPFLTAHTAIDIVARGSYSSHGSSLIVKADGTIWGAGYGSHGSLGNNGGSSTSLVAAVMNGATGMIGVRGIDSYAASGFAFNTTPGKVYSWGYNGYGCLGVGSTAQKSTVTETSFASTGKVIDIQCSSNYRNHSAALLTDNGEVWVAGDGTTAIAGTGSTAQQTSWIKVPCPGVVVKISMTCVSNTNTGIQMLTSDGEIWNTGYNGHGQHGNFTTSTMTMPSKTRI